MFYFVVALAISAPTPAPTIAGACCQHPVTNNGFQLLCVRDGNCTWSDLTACVSPSTTCAWDSDESLQEVFDKGFTRVQIGFYRPNNNLQWLNNSKQLQQPLQCLDLIQHTASCEAKNVFTFNSNDDADDKCGCYAANYSLTPFLDEFTQTKGFENFYTFEIENEATLQTQGFQPRNGHYAQWRFVTPDRRFADTGPLSCKELVRRTDGCLPNVFTVRTDLFVGDGLSNCICYTESSVFVADQTNNYVTYETAPLVTSTRTITSTTATSSTPLPTLALLGPADEESYVAISLISSGIVVVAVAGIGLFLYCTPVSVRASFFNLQ